VNHKDVSRLILFAADSPEYGDKFSVRREAAMRIFVNPTRPHLHLRQVQVSDTLPKFAIKIGKVLKNSSEFGEAGGAQLFVLSCV
jgi:hypothetical protein